MGKIRLDGVSDMHIHAAPDIKERIGDDFEIAKICKNEGMRAIILKSHIENTASRAYLVKQIVPEIEVFGSIVLNTPVGGLNPVAAETALKLGVKEVWLPTLYSQATINKRGNPSGYVFKPNYYSDSNLGETVLDKNGEIKNSCKEIIKLVKEYDVVLGTGHLSEKEIYSVVTFCKDINFSKVLITHPHWIVPNLNDKSLSELVNLGAWVEFCAGNAFPIGYGSVDRVVKSLNIVGPDHCIITSDAGTPKKQFPTEMLRTFIACLLSKEIKNDWIDAIAKHNPAKLLNVI